MLVLKWLMLAPQVRVESFLPPMASLLGVWGGVVTRLHQGFQTAAPLEHPCSEVLVRRALLEGAARDGQEVRLANIYQSPLKHSNSVLLRKQDLKSS